MGYMWDNPDDPSRVQDAKGGDVPGYFGCMFLNHTTDPSGATAPKHVGITSFKFFSGSASFAAGGDPPKHPRHHPPPPPPPLKPHLTGPGTPQPPAHHPVNMS